mgnify:FL=1|jgi:hypothetical protein
MSERSSDEYNGWANWSTWLVPLWIDNGYDCYMEKCRQLKSLPEVTADDAFRISVELWEGTDEIDWNAVDWSEIAEHWEAERLEMVG